MWDETAGERGPNLSAATSGSTSTDDPNGTLPVLRWPVSGPPAPAGAAFATGASAVESLAARYRLLGPLGEGGMGIVYRAEDTRLGRTVAIKTIPAERTANRQAKERFLNEARAASALDHPNLCTVYEIEETPGGQLYLFMPCYDGETLQSRLERGPLPLPEALHIAQQVARGLAKAHRQGIVHCDIKPANLMLTADGVVKILDFGIARLSGQATPVPTRPSGTPKYRSPEQARGSEVGAASDVWSLGMVLYEMMTGQAPQRGEDGQVWCGESARRLRETPAELDAVLCRMLALSPADRYPNAAALLADLDRLAEPIAGVPAGRRAVRLRQRLTTVGLGLAVVLLVLLAGSSIARRRSGSWNSPAAALPPSTKSLVQLTDFPGWTWYPSLSPEGGTLLYVRTVRGRSHIFSAPTIRGAAALDLTADSPADDTQPSFSPDGRQIAFRSERDGGGIFLMSASGGAVRRLTDFGFNPTWSPDGEEIVCGTGSVARPQLRPTESEVFRVEVATGARRRITRGDAAQPSWSPHGRRIAYWGFVSQTGRRLIWTIPAEGGVAIPVVDDDHVNWNPVWSPDGRYLYFASDRSGIMNLWRVPIDEESGRVLGKPEPVTNSQQAAMLATIAKDGRQLAYVGDGSRATLEKVGFDPDTGAIASPATVIVDTSDVIIECGASPDGNWLVYELLTPEEEFFVVHPDGTGRRRIVGDGNKNRRPQFSPDSSAIAFYSDRSGKYEIWSIGVNGRGLAQETRLPGTFVSTPLWSPSGKKLACEVDGREAMIDRTRPLAERAPQFLPLPDKAASFMAYSWSVDGTWLAGVRQFHDGSHDPGILLYSLTAQRYVRSSSRGESPLWLHDSRRLLYSLDGGIFLLDARTGRSLPVLAPAAGSIFRGVSLSPDDRVLYLARIIGEGHIWLLK